MKCCIFPIACIFKIYRCTFDLNKHSINSTTNPQKPEILKILFRYIFKTIFLVLIPFLVSAQCFEEEPGIVWKSNGSIISFSNLAQYTAPMLWFSPDEIRLRDEAGNKQLPDAFPFDTINKQPIVYYKLRHVYGSSATAAVINPETEIKDLMLLNLNYVKAIDLDFYYYFAEEAGPTGHDHDIESVTLQLRILETDDCSDFRFAIKVNKVMGRAHGLHWYNNTLKVDHQTFFPLSILIEEGKHASCPDKNADGIYTPTYDVTERINDAWGIRDIITSGRLVSAGFQAWMAKPREKNSIVFPPLPENSIYLKKMVEKFGDHIVGSQYQLRPYPDYKILKAANKIEKGLNVFMRDKTPHQWPKISKVAGLGKIKQWAKEEKSYRSLSLAYRWDETQRLSLAIPLLIFKNVEAPKTGGWIYNKFYIGDFNNFVKSPSFEFENLLGHQITYSSSASRWVDTYLGVGYEIFDENPDPNILKYKTFLVSEVGIKFRVNIGKTPLKFLRHLGTDFWGIKAGWKNLGFSPFVNSGFVIEIGAGAF